MDFFLKSPFRVTRNKECAINNYIYNKFYFLPFKIIDTYGKVLLTITWFIYLFFHQDERQECKILYCFWRNLVAFEEIPVTLTLKHIIFSTTGNNFPLVLSHHDQWIYQKFNSYCNLCDFCNLRHGLKPPPFIKGWVVNYLKYGCVEVMGNLCLKKGGSRAVNHLEKGKLFKS